MLCFGSVLKVHLQTRYRARDKNRKVNPFPPTFPPNIIHSVAVCHLTVLWESSPHARLELRPLEVSRLLLLFVVELSSAWQIKLITLSFPILSREVRDP